MHYRLPAWTIGSVAALVATAFVLAPPSTFALGSSGDVGHLLGGQATSRRGCASRPDAYVGTDCKTTEGAAVAFKCSNNLNVSDCIGSPVPSCTAQQVFCTGCKSYEKRTNCQNEIDSFPNVPIVSCVP